MGSVASSHSGVGGGGDIQLGRFLLSALAALSSNAMVQQELCKSHAAIFRLLVNVPSVSEVGEEASVAFHAAASKIILNLSAQPAFTEAFYAKGFLGNLVQLTASAPSSKSKFGHISFLSLKKKTILL